ncbi:MAG: membrane protein insertase YidC [Spirochaetota bacterium]|nr:membrane protein insertase YidC [Spirochaetota bacterium]
MDKKMILAIILSLLIWVVWLNYFKKPEPKTAPEPNVSQKEQIEKEKERVIPKSNEVKEQISIHPSRSVKERNISIVTNKYIVNFSNKGGIITSFVFNDRKIELVVSNSNAKGFFDFPIHFSRDEFLKGNALEDTLWNHSSTTRSIIFYTSLSLSGGRFRLEKIFTFNDDKYFFNVEYKIINTGKKDLSFPNRFVIVSPSDFLGPAMDFSNTYNTLTSVYYINDELEKGTKGGGFFSKSSDLEGEDGKVGWTGIMSRYFLLLMISENFNGNGVIYDARNNTGFRTGMYIPISTIKRGEVFKKSFTVYAGEKNKDILSALDERTEDAADVNSFIEPIRDFVLWCLKKINSVVGNFGWALVIFSILSKIVLLPLTQRSTESMKKMQSLAPQINELKEKYKDKPNELNKKTMELYKKNKVNPLGGCLPLLLQMPFFFALYSALINSIDLWQAPFILWIKDLSMPDTVYAIKGFNINILPLIMTATTFFQQKVSSGEVAGQQQKMMMFMPIILLFIFWSMPSGLVLYWTLQNLLQILHQVYINKRGKNDVITT